MIEESISIDLPLPWSNEVFETDELGVINYLVGPNGSGKTRFAAELLNQLNGRVKGARLLGTDRLKEMANPGVSGRYFGDNFASGYSKSHFSNFRQAGQEGSGIDTILLLEDRMDLRIQIEATLSHLFNREITLDWEEGHIIPRAIRREGGASYRLDREECHGIKELFVLLTHLYDNQHSYLIIDEPELNLHPQYQAFFMQEVRKVVGSPHTGVDKKVVFLITHSPFILDLRNEDDVKSIISFDLEYSVPKQVAHLDSDVPTLMFAAGKLNAHHKQLFFSDNPIFVEGPHDARIIEALIDLRGVSIAGAGSCIIDSGGVEEVTNYLRFCQGIGKEAYFVYDLDSLFTGRLSRCVGDDKEVRSLLADAGVGGDFVDYMGALYRLLTSMIDTLLSTTLDDNLDSLGNLLRSFGNNRKNWNPDQLAKARVAVMTAISRCRDEILSEMSETDNEGIVQDIEGRWSKILDTLRERNIHILPGGALERYLPSFEGDIYRPTPESKNRAFEAELRNLLNFWKCPDESREALLQDRYGDLYSVIKRLPSKSEVDIDTTLRRHLSDYIHEIQKVVKDDSEIDVDDIETKLREQPLAKSGVVSIKRLDHNPSNGFTATIEIKEMLGKGPRVLGVDEGTTIWNMEHFQEVTSDSSAEVTQ